MFQTTRFTGEKPGPHLLISAGVHGDEYLPMLAVKELVRIFERQNMLRGSLTLIPVVNLSAFHRGHRCGEDDLDLARTCAGRSDGSITERVAFQLSQKIEAADFYIDLHTGGTELSVLPLAGYVLHPDGEILERQRKMARAFQLPFVWGSSAKLPGRSLSVARDAGVPAIYIEYYGAHRELSEAAAGPMDLNHPLVTGCLNVMRHLEMIEGLKKRDVDQEVIEDWRPESGHMQICHLAPETGFFTPAVELGQTVKAGELIGKIVSDKPHSVLAEEDGKVVVLREYPRIRKGDATAVLAVSHQPT